MPLPSWSCVNSFIRLPINISWPPSMRPHYVRRIAAMPPLHDLKTTLTSTTLTGMSLSHLYNEVSVLRVRSRCRTPRLVQPLPMFSSLPKTVRASHFVIHTRIGCGWLRFSLWSGHWLVTSKPIVIPYHLLTCRSLSCIYTISSLWPRTS